MRVAVFHPGTQHSYHTAMAFQEAGLLAWYATGVYYRPDAWPFRAVRWLPAGRRSGLTREFGKRCLSGLDERLIVTHGVGEWMVLAAQRFWPLASLVPGLIRRRNRGFASWAGRRSVDTVDVTIGYDTASLEAFRTAREHGVRTVLDQSTCFAGYVVDVLRDEIEAHPDFGGEDARKRLHTLQLIAPRHAAEVDLADLVLVGCSFAGSTLPEKVRSSGRVRVCPYGADIPEQSSTRPEQHRALRLLYAGGIHSTKGIYYLLEAVRMLGSPNVQLTMVGHLSFEPRALEPYRQWVTHVPHVPRVELMDIYRQADAFVFPSLCEGFGMVLIEAAAAGLPILATTSTGAPDLIGDSGCGRLVPPRDADALAAEIEHLASHQGECREMGAAAYERAKAFSWAAYRQRVVAAVLGGAEAACSRSGV